MTNDTWTAQRIGGVWPANNWQLRRVGRPYLELVVHGEDEDVMHVLEALNAYERTATEQQPVEATR